MSAEVLIHVQHLLGIGHLRRASRLAAALAEAGLETVVASGGIPVAGLELGAARLEQLPAARAADASFSGLVDHDGRPVDDAWKAARRAATLALFERLRPRVLLLELFPFGRRALRFELLALLEAARRTRPRPWVVVSLRDLLNRPAPEKAAWAVEIAARHVDRVLVHGDPAVARLDELFPETRQIADRLLHTGYIAPPIPQGAARTGEVLVSTGGGAVGAPLAEAAIAARPLSRRLADAPWRVLLGANMPQAEVDRLAARAGPGVRVERARGDFLELLAGCRVSVSQAGYNTVMEILAAGVPAVVVPFAAGGQETEQPLRAERLAARGLLETEPEAALTPARLAAAVDRADSRGPGAGHGLALDGIANSLKIVRQLAATLPPDRTAGPERDG